jgi:hypothetical protein
MTGSWRNRFLLKTQKHKALCEKSTAPTHIFPDYPDHPTMHLSSLDEEIRRQDLIAQTLFGGTKLDLEPD